MCNLAQVLFLHGLICIRTALCAAEPYIKYDHRASVRHWMLMYLCSIYTTINVVTEVSVDHGVMSSDGA
jgi:hypothetical protein